MVSPLVLLVIDQVRWKERPCSLHRQLAEADVCDGVYQLVFLSPEALLSNETWRDTVPSPVYQENLVAVVIDEFYQHSCHVTLGGNVTNYIPLWNENLAHVTRRIFPSLPRPLSPAHAHHEEKYGWLVRLEFMLRLCVCLCGSRGVLVEIDEQELRCVSSLLWKIHLFAVESRRSPVYIWQFTMTSFNRNRSIERIEWHHA